MKANQTVRTLDFSDFVASRTDSSRRNLFCEDLVQCLGNVGFVKLINHGITEQELQAVFEWSKRFFSLPLVAKQKAAHPPQANPHRGYSYVGQERLSMVKDYEKGKRDAEYVYDVKESLDIGPASDDLYPNIWPDEADIPGFRNNMESLYERCHHVHQAILEALAVGLGIRPSFLRNLCEQNTSELRLNHYPGCDIASLPQGSKRISEHTDFGTITLLFQDSVGGLEIEDQHHQGHYFPIPLKNKSEMIINIGDCLQRWTNNKFRSTSHRVVFSQDKSASVEDRFSVAYFGKPNRSQDVGTLGEFLCDGETPKYSPLTAWEYNQRKLALTY